MIGWLIALPQAAFFNGDAYEAWEDIWGMYNQLTPRDSEALRRTAAILRHFGGFTQSEAWAPHRAAWRVCKRVATWG